MKKSATNKRMKKGWAVQRLEQGAWMTIHIFDSKDLDGATECVMSYRNNDRGTAYRVESCKY